MKDKAKPGRTADPKSVVQKARIALERLSAEAERLRKISELQSLKQNPVALSVDTKELLDSTKNSHFESRSFATLDEMMLLLCLMSAHSDPQSAALTSADHQPNGSVDQIE
jgi:hypothetical protein